MLRLTTAISGVSKMKIQWNHDKVKEEALKYNTRSIFQRKMMGAYEYAVRHGILEEVCSHMEVKKNKWTKELIKEVALKYNTRREFQIGNRGAYQFARKHNLLDEVCSHMIFPGNTLKRCIYVCEFPDNHCYIGLTYNMQVRENRRVSNENDIVTIHKDKTGLEYTYKMLTDGYVDAERAMVLEGEFLEEYRNNGWFTLNRCKTGGLGSITNKWDYDSVKQEALLYKTRSAFKKGSKGAYDYARKHKIINEVCSHMEIKKHKWTYDMVKEEALKYNTRTEFYKGSRNACEYARKNNIMNDVCSHMK